MSCYVHVHVSILIVIEASECTLHMDMYMCVRVHACRGHYRHALLCIVAMVQVTYMYCSYCIK